MDNDLEKKLNEVDFEDLLNYRMSRLFGKNIKNSSLAKIVYNEVLPQNNCGPDDVMSSMGYMEAKTNQPTPKVKMHGGNVVCEPKEIGPLGENLLEGSGEELEAAGKTQSIAQLINFAANYAAQALEFANQTLKDAPDLSDCKTPSTVETIAAIPEHQAIQPTATCQNPDIQPAVGESNLEPCPTTIKNTCCSCSPTANLNQAMFNDMVQQLNRIEMMTREMYTTNRELYKSILKYCKNYIYNNMNNNDC